MNQAQQLCPHTVLWALGNPEGWRASPASDEGPACIEATRTLSIKGCERSMTAWVALEYDTLETVRDMMAEALSNADEWLAHRVAGENGLAQARFLGGGRYSFKDAHTAGRELASLRQCCRFATAEVAA